jgi:hypothetical protein
MDGRPCSVWAAMMACYVSVLSALSSALSVRCFRASRKCCSRTDAAKASTSGFRPRVEPPCSQMAARARAVLMRSSQNSSGNPVRLAIVAAMSRAAEALSSSVPSGDNGRPTTTPTGRCSEVSSSSRGMGRRLPARRTRVSSGEARVWVSSLSASPIRISPQSTPRMRPVSGIRTTAPSLRRTLCCSSCASFARAGIRSTRRGACPPGSSAAGTPG